MGQRKREGNNCGANWRGLVRQEKVVGTDSQIGTHRNFVYLALQFQVVRPFANFARVNDSNKKAIQNQ